MTTFGPCAFNLAASIGSEATDIEALADDAHEYVQASNDMMFRLLGAFEHFNALANTRGGTSQAENFKKVCAGLCEHAERNGVSMLPVLLEFTTALLDLRAAVASVSSQMPPKCGQCGHPESHHGACKRFVLCGTCHDMATPEHPCADCDPNKKQQP
jgi:hypothetical protein